MPSQSSPMARFQLSERYHATDTMAACEIVWVRCNEPAGPLLSVARRTGQRLSIVDKCDTNRQASPTMRARNSARPGHNPVHPVHGLTPSPAPKQVQNVGEEGFGYLSWIVERWESLPPCASIISHA